MLLRMGMSVTESGLKTLHTSVIRNNNYMNDMKVLLDRALYVDGRELCPLRTL